jgi:hypothetical protein
MYFMVAWALSDMCLMLFEKYDIKVRKTIHVACFAAMPLMLVIVTIYVMYLMIVGFVNILYIIEKKYGYLILVNKFLRWIKRKIVNFFRFRGEDEQV